MAGPTRELLDHFFLALLFSRLFPERLYAALKFLCDVRRIVILSETDRLADRYAHLPGTRDMLALLL